MSRRQSTVATIHLGALRANFAVAQEHAEGRELIAVVKADAYGHGAVPSARALADAGCRRFAVANVAEGAELRDAAVGEALLVLGGVSDVDEADAVVGLGLTPVVHHGDHVAWLADAARRGPGVLGVQVEVDTGMRRMGVPSGEAVALLESISREPALALEGVYTHLAWGDEPDLAPTLGQLGEFRRVVESAAERGVELGLIHVAHSAGLLAGKAVADALPEAAAVRPGLMLYGVRPAPHLEANLRPVMTLRTRVAHVRRVEAGDSVGYSGTFRAAAATRVATLAIGYADGVPVASSNRGSVLLRGQRRPIVGRVSMDFIGVDVGDVPVEIGDEAILFGEGQGTRLPVEEAAAAADTISYELLVRVGSRVRRVFTDD